MVYNSFKNIQKIGLLFSCLLGLSSFASGQQEVYLVDSTSIPEYQDKPKAEYETMACRAAKNKALVNEFGSSVSQNFEKITEMVQTGQYQIDHFSRFQTVYENTYPNGIWVKNKQAPKIKEYKKGETWWMKCIVKGYGRKKTMAEVNFNAKPLNGNDVSLDERLHFNSGERFYLSFETPEPGYLLVAYSDFDKVYQLLPYEGMSQTKLKVEANTDYLFFDPGKTHAGKYLSNDYKPTTNFKGNKVYKVVDPIKLTTDDKASFEQVIVIFSREKFNAPLFNQDNMEKNQGELPKATSRKNFMKWLQAQRVYKQQLQVEKIGMIVRNSE